MLELREKDRNAIIQIAIQTLGNNAEVWAYGSRVNGGSHETSDLDLVIKTPLKTPLLPEQLTKFKLELQESNIPINVQSLDWNAIPENFKKNILMNYVVLIGGN